MSSKEFQCVIKLGILMWISLLSILSKAQNVSIKQDNKIEKLLNEKRKINSSITINDGYKIQIFNGSSEESKKKLVAFKKENKTVDATIVFSTPNYKVLVGNYKTRIEAEHDLLLFRKKYPTSFMVKPNK
jgi:hypothetical protein